MSAVKGLRLRTLKSKEFDRFARKNELRNRDLLRAIEEILSGSVDADLGGGVFKQRVRRKGQGKSGGFRTIILLRTGSLAIFVYGFAKKDRANISDEELRTWRSVARDLLATEAAVKAAIASGKLIEVVADEEDE